MATIHLDMNTYILHVPASDKSFFLALVKKMGWSAKKTKAGTRIPSETLAALSEAKEGKDAGVVNMKSLDSFMKSME